MRRLRTYSLREEGPEPIFSLFERVYGDSEPLRRRWQWEWLQHPQSGKIQINVAEQGERLVGMTVRMPLTLLVGGQRLTGWTAGNSMVDPACRGEGIISQLYERANCNGELQVSKGTASDMRRQLQKMGYVRALPDTYQVCLLNPLRWLKQKMGIFDCKSDVDKVLSLDGFEDFEFIDLFPEEVQGFPVHNAIVPEKTVKWLNWRYVDIPHREYRIVMRRDGESPVSWCVLRFSGQAAYLVDFRWDLTRRDEPARTIRYAKLLAKKFGATKLTVWSSSRTLRRVLTTAKFFNRKDSPAFNYLDPGAVLPRGMEFAFVHGDGDIDYL